MAARLLFREVVCIEQRFSAIPLQLAFMNTTRNFVSWEDANEPQLHIGDAQMTSSVQSVAFTDDVTLAMGAAFDLACASLKGFSRDHDAREAIAKRIIEAATKGERDPVRLHAQAFMGFSVDQPSLRAPLRRTA